MLLLNLLVIRYNGGWAPNLKLAKVGALNVH